MQRKYFKFRGGSVIVKVLLLTLSSTALLLSGCDQGDKPGKSGKKEAQQDKLKKTEPSAPKDEMSKKIEALTGDHSRLLWSRYLGKSADVFVNGKQHQLWGIDTRDGLGVRAILEDKANYSRPLISPDGKWIIYTNKHTERKGSVKSFKPVMHLVDWSGGQAKELGKGFAVDIWQDPETRKVWVYTVNLLSTERSSMFADKLERFALDAPEKRELVWKKTKISIDNIQLSLDGKRASCLFPWPSVGVIDLEKKEYWRNQHGCWPSLAPDNSYVAWVFDGSHKSVHVFADRGKKLSVVPINKGPGMEGKEMYHPRWSNDTRFMTLTGPYKGATIGKSGKHAEIYIGKFDAQMKSVEGWVRVTDDKKADHFPDLWIKGGEKSSLGKIGAEDATTVAGNDAVAAKKWPSQTEALVYLWKNADAQNQIDSGGGKRACKVEARQRARFGRHFEMLTGGGYFEADPASAKILEGYKVGADLGIQLNLAVDGLKQQGVILSGAGFQIEQKSEALFLVTQEGSFSLGQLKAGIATHLALSLKGGKWALYRDGKVLPGDLVEKEAIGKTARSVLRVGDGTWDGRVVGLAVYQRALAPSEVEEGAAYWLAQWKKRQPVARVKLQGKLLEMTEMRSVEALDTYRRALLAYTYQVEQVTEGKYEQKKVIVNHWSIMDRKALSGIPRKIGQSYKLEIEPMDQHPELTSERRWNDSFELMDEYFDVITPEA